MVATTMAAVAILLFLFILFIRSIFVVRQAELVIIERLGKFHRVLSPGIHIILPFFDRPRQVTWSFVAQAGEYNQYLRYTKVLNRIDVREAVYDFPKQNVITKDNVTMEINALLYYHITDAHAAVYQVYNLPEAIEKLTQTTLRNVIGSMDLDESLVSRDLINEKLRIILDEATDKWGVKVSRVELQEVNPPEDIRHAMEKQMRAERDRRAAILEAEGAKSSAILHAQGIQESQVLKAQGHAQAQLIEAEAQASARMTIANAEAQAVQVLKNALGNNVDPIPYLVTTEYLKTLPTLMSGKNDKLVVVPYEATGLVGALSSLVNLVNTSKTN